MFPFYVILPENDKEDISLKQIDETYFTNPNPKNMTDIESIIGDDEQILWRGKPKKNAYVLNAIFKMLPIALIWLLFDGVFIGGEVSLPNTLLRIKSRKRRLSNFRAL